LKNAPTQLSKDLNHGDGYRYAHNEEFAYAAGEFYLPQGVKGDFYQPNPRGMEKQFIDKLAFLAELDKRAESGKLP
jgi:putative ATPase